MSRLESLFNRCWYGRGPGCGLFVVLLAPLSLVFRGLVALRRWFYALGLTAQVRLPVPVIVVGNLTTGGAGKTPLTLALVAWLKEAGYRPGIISRGYGGHHGGQADAPMAVDADTDPDLAGDEPVLMASRSGCPVWVGRQRAAAGQGLLARHPEVDVLVADDGLQHLALARDIEVVVVDGARGLGNGWLLPAGPLRESPRRLGQADAVVVNGPGAAWNGGGYAMTLVGSRFRNLRTSGGDASARDFAGMEVHALAGIGNPRRFFDHLAGLGLRVVAHPFPDHHAYEYKDLPPGPLVMTEKDAVKVAPLVQATGRQDAWYLEIDAMVDGGLKDLILNRLREVHGPQAA
ncbi:MAG: tetraacyldisaccharide 4'-kinase [Pseudomonadota bacterium]